MHGPWPSAGAHVFHGAPGERQLTASKGHSLTHYSAPAPPQPTRACFAQAQFDFSAQDPSQLSLRRGDIVEVVECGDPHWWRGRAGGRLGFFPRSYVQPVQL